MLLLFATLCISFQVLTFLVRHVNMCTLYIYAYVCTFMHLYLVVCRAPDITYNVFGGT